MGENLNDAHLPTGGGLDFLSVGPSAEPGCLEFMVGDRVVQIMKSRSLTLERIDSAGIPSSCLSLITSILRASMGPMRMSRTGIVTPSPLN